VWWGKERIKLLSVSFTRPPTGNVSKIWPNGVLAGHKELWSVNTLEPELHRIWKLLGPPRVLPTSHRETRSHVRVTKTMQQYSPGTALSQVSRHRSRVNALATASARHINGLTDKGAGL